MKVVFAILLAAGSLAAPAAVSTSQTTAHVPPAPLLEPAATQLG